MAKKCVDCSDAILKLLEDMDIKVITIGEPDLNVLPEDTQQYFYEAILTAIEKLYTALPPRRTTSIYPRATISSATQPTILKTASAANILTTMIFGRLPTPSTRKKAAF